MSAEIQAWYEDYQRKMRAELTSEIKAELKAQAILTAFRVRRIDVPEEARARILAEKDLSRLERWHEKAIVAPSVAEVLQDPS